MTDVVKKESTTTHNSLATAPGEDVQTQTTVTGASVKVAPSQTVIYVIYFLLSSLEILLAFRLILKLTGANPGSPFVDFIYGLSQIFVWPFLGIFSQATSQGLETTAVLEPATIIAMVVYAVLAWMIVKLYSILTGKPQEEA